MKNINNELIILRDYIEKKLKQVPSGERIRIRKDILEKLLFEYKYDKIYRQEYKLPVWSGPFLSKIDLSCIDFSFVSWSMGNMDEPIIDYSNTNANIDFNASWEAKTNNYVILKRCDFHGTDLSNNHLVKIFAYATNLSNTKLFLNNSEALFEMCDLSSLNLSDLCIKLPLNPQEGNRFECSFDCNLENTSINISLNYIELLNDSAVKEKLYWMIKKGYLNGCYINNALISNKMSMGRISELLYLDQEMFKGISNSINDQIRTLKKTKK